MNLSEIEKEANRIVGVEHELYRFLYDLSYNNPSRKEYLPLYERFLKDSRADIKSVSIKAILFFLKERDDKFREVALGFVCDNDEDEDLRMTSALGLSAAFFATKNVEIMAALYDLIFNEEELNDILKAAFFESMLSVFGLTSVERLKRNRQIMSDFSSIELTQFEDELTAIRKLLKRDR